MPKNLDLARLMDSPLLARVVPHLPPETLHQIIRHQGLDACGELVMAATPAQLNAILDIDLWRHAQPGRDDQFDVNRFGEWLDALADIDDSVAARTVASIDKHVVVAGLSRYIRVLDPGIFEPIEQSDDERIDRRDAMLEGGGDGPECEVGGYIVRSRRADAWDAIVTLLATLDAEHADAFHAIMEGCRGLANSTPETDGLDDLLQESEQQLHELTIEREQRRSQQGYATPADARAFLLMARHPREAMSVNPIVAAYFRAADETPEPSNEIPRSPELKLESAARTTDVPESLDAVFELLADAGVIPEPPRALLAAADTGPQDAKLTHLRRLMSDLGHADPISYFTRTRELAFLTNVLVAGCSVQSRPFRPQEAADAAAAICNLGLEHAPVSDLVSAFEAGWSVLHRDVSLFTADELIATLPNVDCADRDIKRGLVAFRRTLATERKAGTPWRARDAAEILSMLDMSAWIGVVGLLGECPVLPAALTAALAGRTTAVSQTEFEFISTRAQIDDVTRFMKSLPELLSP